MPLRIALDNYYVIVFSAITVVISIFISFYIYLQAKKSPLLHLYMLTQLMLILWVFSKILKTAVPNIYLRWSFIVLQYLGICFLGSIFVMFAYTYSTGRMMRRRSIILLHIPPLLQFVVVLTNPLHMLFYSYFDMYRDSFGSLFYLHQAFTYVYLIGGIILCSRNFRKQFGHHRIQATLFAVAILLPIAVNLLYVFSVFKKVFGIRLPMDITPISCILSLLIFAIAAFRYRFVDITPLAYTESLRQSLDGILLVDKNGNILEKNNAFDRYFNSFQAYGPVTTIHDVMNILTPYSGASDLHKLTNSLNPMTYAECNANLCVDDNTYYNVLIEPVFNHKRSYSGALVRFIDDSFRKKMLDILTDRNEELSRANRTLEKKAEAQRQLTITRVRSFLAKEVHDILGHSVVLVVAMLEVAIMNIRNGNRDMKDYLNHSVRLLKNGLEELENSTRENFTEKSDNTSLFQSLQLIAEQLQSSGITLEITEQGLPRKLDSRHSDHVYRICREAVTNAVRHGKATLINIIFRFYHNHYELYILDNGSGCDSIIKGIGLKGMEEKASELGGLLHYNSSRDNGFQLFFSTEF